MKQGGWRLGLLVARNVEKRKAGQPSKEFSGRKILGGKVTASEFARLSGTTAPRVLRYLEAWERGADAGHVPPGSELTPGAEPEPDVDVLPPWSGRVRPQRITRNPKSARGSPLDPGASGGRNARSSAIAAWTLPSRAAAARRSTASSQEGWPLGCGGAEIAPRSTADREAPRSCASATSAACSRSVSLTSTRQGRGRWGIRTDDTGFSPGVRRARRLCPASPSGAWGFPPTLCGIRSGVLFCGAR